MSASLPLRKLSVKLASLCIEDREWILAQLAPAERQTLNELLAELDELGLLQDPALLQAMLAEPVMEQLQTERFQQQRMAFAGLQRSSHPAWAALFLHGLTPECQKQVSCTLSAADAPIVEWLARLSGVNIPPALHQALQQQAAKQGDGYGR